MNPRQAYNTETEQYKIHAELIHFRQRLGDMKLASSAITEGMRIRY